MLRTPWGDADSLHDRQLSPGRGRDREAVRGEQRERLFAAMVATCATKGFESTSVADLLKLSGVSRASFYAQFDDKLDCYCAAEAEIVAAAIAATTERLDGEGSEEARARAALEAFVELIVAQPAAARMCLVESYAAGEPGIAPIRAAIEQIVSLGREALGRMPGRAGMPADLARAIVGGFYQVIYHRLQDHREAELPGLVPALWDWAMSYWPPPHPLHRSGRRGFVSIDATMPPFAAYSPEQRLIRAFSSVVAEQGYSATTIADIAAAASISQTTFYLYFADKADALAAALDSSTAQMIAASLPSARRAPDWPSAVRIGFEATCGWMASEPDFAKLRIVEVYAAGPAAITVRDRGGAEFLGALLGPAAAAGMEVSAIVLEATVGAVYGVFSELVRQGNVAKLPELAPLLTYLTLAPALGPEQASLIANETGPAQRRR